MGVRGLARLIKETEGTLAHDLKSTVVHLDILSVYFSLINTLQRCFAQSRKGRQGRQACRGSIAFIRVRRNSTHLQKATSHTA